MLDAYLYEGLRTPFGRHAGALAKVRPDDLLADAIRNRDEEIRLQAGADRGHRRRLRQPGRRGQPLRGAPCGPGGRTCRSRRPGTVLQRNCASGLGALVHAAHAITAGEGDVFLVGGVESMSRSPLVMSRVGIRLRARHQALRQHDRPALLQSQAGQAVRRRPDAADRGQPGARSTSIKRERSRHVSRCARSSNMPSPKAKASSPAKSRRSNCRPRAKARCRRSPTTSIRGPTTDLDCAGQDEAAVRRRRHHRRQCLRRQ